MTTARAARARPHHRARRGRDARRATAPRPPSSRPPAARHPRAVRRRRRLHAERRGRSAARVLRGRPRPHRVRARRARGCAGAARWHASTATGATPTGRRRAPAPRSPCATAATCSASTRVSAAAPTRPLRRRGEAAWACRRPDDPAPDQRLLRRQPPRRSARTASWASSPRCGPRPPRRRGRGPGPR